MNVEYKIYHISKTKKNSWYKKTRFRTFCIFWYEKNIQKILRILNDYISQQKKSENWFFIRFRTLRNIFDQNKIGFYWGMGGRLHVVNRRQGL